jgi:hypothetical protein
MPRIDYANLTTAAEVNLWVARLAARGRKVFSEDLRPPSSIEIILDDAWPNFDTSDVHGRLCATVEYVVRRRSDLLVGDPEELRTPVAGRCIAVNTVFVDAIGLAMETGLVDRFDVPAWDFWISASVEQGACLIYSWIPPSYVDEMQRSVDLCPSAALQWVEDVARHRRRQR